MRYKFYYVVNIVSYKRLYFMVVIMVIGIILIVMEVKNYFEVDRIK